MSSSSVHAGQKWIAIAVALVVVLGVAGVASADINLSFDTPVVTGPTQAPGVWYTDRYAPAGFSSPEFFDGDNRLKQTISDGDGASSRPGAYTSSFYNTQGRKYDLETGTTTMSIDLFIDSSWATTGRRMAGFWGTAFDGLGYAVSNITAFPIIEFTSTTTDGSGVPRFRGWDDANGWIDMGLPTGFAYDTWQTLSIVLSGGMINYTVGDLALSVSSLGSAEIGNVILQGHNTTDGVNYDIYWDNFGSSPAVVPEAGSLIVWSLVLCSVGKMTWRRRQSASR